jgi:uncharacterized membrane protein YhdT
MVTHDYAILCNDKGEITVQDVVSQLGKWKKAGETYETAWSSECEAGKSHRWYTLLAMLFLSIEMLLWVILRYIINDGESIIGWPNWGSLVLLLLPILLLICLVKALLFRRRAALCRQKKEEVEKVFDDFPVVHMRRGRLPLWVMTKAVNEALAEDPSDNPSHIFKSIERVCNDMLDKSRNHPPRIKTCGDCAHYIKNPKARKPKMVCAVEVADVSRTEQSCDTSDDWRYFRPACDSFEAKGDHVGC